MFGAEHYWKLSMVGQQVKFVCADIISIKDSYALLPMALRDLGNQLEDHECIYQKQYAQIIKGKWGKGIYPYEYITSTGKFDETVFPPIEAFNNSLGNKVFEDDYINAKEFFNKHCTTFRDYHDYYLRQDVLILTDALIKFRNELFELVNLDLFRTASLPQFSYTAMLAYSKKKIPYITNPTMYDTAEAGLKGCLNIVAKKITQKRKYCTLI